MFPIALWTPQDGGVSRATAGASYGEGLDWQGFNVLFIPNIGLCNTPAAGVGQPLDRRQLR